MRYTRRLKMKLIGKLKEKVSKAGSKEEALEMIKEAGMVLTDEELKQASGGESTEIKEFVPATILIMKGSGGLSL